VISESSIEACVDYLRDSATEAAQATANRQHLEKFTSTIKSLIMSEHLAEPVNAQERYAYSDTRYKNHLEGLKVSIFEDERFRNLRDAAEVKIRAWQTMCSNERGKL
jgi:hypothetical protein